MFTFESARCTVWLDDLDERTNKMGWGGRLCRRHADALAPPRGWELLDRRGAPAEPDLALLHAETPLLSRAFRAAGT